MSNKTVIVTGASSGLGFAIAKAYLARGYNVVGNARTEERLQQAAAAFGETKGKFVAVAGDIASPDTARKLFATAIESFGKVDILINNAGIFIAKPLVEYSEDDLESIVATNIKGFFYPSQEAARHMAANKDGHIVTITASLGMQPNRKVPALLPVLIKGGLNQATRALSIELSTSNVRVNAVAPGIIETPLHGSKPETIAALKSLTASGEIGKAEDIVDAVLYLTDSTYTSGLVMNVDGGSSSGTW